MRSMSKFGPTVAGSLICVHASRSAKTLHLLSMRITETRPADAKFGSAHELAKPAAGTVKANSDVQARDCHNIEQGNGPSSKT